MIKDLQTRENGHLGDAEEAVLGGVFVALNDHIKKDLRID